MPLHVRLRALKLERKKEIEAGRLHAIVCKVVLEYSVSYHACSNIFIYI